MPSWADLGSPGSRARCFRTCSGVWAARGSVAPLDIGAPDGAFRFLLQRRRPGVFGLRGCIPGPHVPLSTLRRRPRERLRMTQGRCGSLLHIRMTLSFTTPRRFNRRTRSTNMKYRLLGKSGLRVSEASLGTMTFGDEWGWGSLKAEAQKVYETYREAGGNFIDTANFYTG